MKKRLIYWGALLSAVLFSGCATDHHPEKNWETYTNTRYGFSIQYPSDWPIGMESDNGDGIQLYIGNPDADIRAYAAIYDPEISDAFLIQDENIKRQPATLDNGAPSTLLAGKENGVVHFEMVYISETDPPIEFHFYAKVSEQFFQDNEKILMKIARSMNPNK